MPLSNNSNNSQITESFIRELTVLSQRDNNLKRHRRSYHDKLTNDLLPAKPCHRHSLDSFYVESGLRLSQLSSVFWFLLICLCMGFLFLFLEMAFDTVFKPRNVSCTVAKKSAGLLLRKLNDEFYSDTADLHTLITDTKAFLESLESLK